MSIERCKASLLQLLSDPSNRVIALSGSWGTGKSHLWREVQKASKDEAIKKAPYVSLFGVSTITELKLRLVQECIPLMDSSIGKVVSDYGKAAKKILTAVSSKFSALDDVALLAAPKLLRDRFIVVDDVERKHEKLSIDEVLGFIDDLIQNKNCRVLVILNTDKIGDKGLWDQLREKVIDHELRLDTSPGEAFDIACKIIPTTFGQEVRAAVETCTLSNIRVICKILRVVNRLLADYQHITQDMTARTIPSTVLLSAIYYKGLEDGPTIEFVLGFHVDTAALRAATRSRSKDPISDEDKARARWMLLLQQLKINSVDDFETVVVTFLQSGLLDDSALKKVVARYCSEAGILNARRHAEEFFARCNWHPEVPESELVQEARGLTADIEFLDPLAVTALHDQLITMSGGATVAQDMLDTWIDNFRRTARRGDFQRAEDFSLFGQRFHPKIKAEFDAIFAGHRSKLTLPDVCRSIVEKNGWGGDEEAVMKSTSPADFEVALRGLTGEDLKLFLLKNLDLYINRANYIKHFGPAMDNFLDACKAIYAKNDNPRLTAVIRRSFAGSNLDGLLEPHASVGESVSPSPAGGN